MLLSHRWKHLWRSGPASTRILKILLVGGFIAYASFSLAVTGYVLPELLASFGYLTGAVDLLNEHLLLLAVFLLPSRFLLQRSLKLDIRPYLSLPIPHRTLVGFAQLAGLASLFNIVPLAFIVPFWIRSIVPEVSTLPAVLWLAACIVLLLCTHFITEGLRLLHLRFARLFRGVVSLIILTVVADIGLGTGVLSSASVSLFTGLLNGHITGLLILVFLLGALATGAALLLETHLRHGAIPVQRQPYSFSPAFFEREAGPTGRLLLLDWTLLLRNRRPRRSLILAFVISILNVPLLLTPEFGADVFAGALAAGFALILLPSSYGQYLFSWDSEHFDGFLSWPVEARDIIRARLLMLIFLSLGIFVCVMPFFYMLAPEHLLLLSSFLVYVVGIASPALIYVGLWNNKRIRLSKEAVLNYEGLSMKQFMVNLPIFVPPIAILTMVPLESALWILTAVGGLGLVAFPLWVRLFTRQLKQRRYRMASGFRTLET